MHPTWTIKTVIFSAHPLVDRGNLKSALDTHLANVVNARGFSGTAAAWLDAYLDWANDTAQALQNALRPEEINRLVFTPRYAALLAAAGTGLAERSPRVVNGLLRAELQQRAAAFEELHDAVHRQVSGWSQAAMFVVCDTDFLLHNGKTLGHIPFHRLIIDAGNAHQVQLRQGRNAVHLLIPSQVLLELDKAKNTNRESRTAARVTLRTIDEWFEKPEWVYREQESSGASFGGDSAQFSAELVLDPLGHVPLEVGDDEIIDRILACRPLAGRPITLITYDTHMSTKARAHGIPVIKPEQP